MAKKRKRRKKKQTGRRLLSLCLLLAVAVAAVCWKYALLSQPLTELAEQAEVLTGQLWDRLDGLLPAVQGESISLDDLPAYDGSPYVVLDDNQPGFTEEERAAADSYESYALLDALGRCGTAEACIGADLMPAEERGDISFVYPTGWEQNSYDFVSGGVLYNRCHLIGFQLTGENANERNLITGTRYLNVEGMLPFENLVADYIEETDNHVLYRVTPVFQDTELVARGVEMEAWSVEDDGDGVCFHVFCYNVQPGVEIDYASGENWAAEERA